MLTNVIELRITLRTIIRADAVLTHVVDFLNRWFGVVMDSVVFDITDEYEDEEVNA